MSFRKFNPSDIILNTMKAHPNCEFFIFDSNVFYNNTGIQSGSRNTQVTNVAAGAISLYEYNIDRPYVATNRPIGGAPFMVISDTEKRFETYNELINALPPVKVVQDTARIYPWISKDSAGASFKTVNSTGYANEFAYGDIMTGSYPLSASIRRQLIPATGDGSVTSPSASYSKHFESLKNRLNFYALRSEHYKVSSSLGNKGTSTLNLISVPTIFFGSQIKPGTISLRWYLSGTLIGELKDTKQNGELIETTGLNTGTVAGVVLYDEGYFVLTGSLPLSEEEITLDDSTQKPSWIRYGVGANDGITPNISASFGMTFKGTTETQVMTMFANARRGQANYSNNPTYLKYGQDSLQFTSSQVYEENSQRLIANTVSSSYNDYSGSFKRQVYISRVALYDENKNLIGVATLSSPVLKKEDEDLSFKLKLDI